MVLLCNAHDVRLFELKSHLVTTKRFHSMSCRSRLNMNVVFFPGISRKGARSDGQGATDVGERVGTDSHASLTNISGLAQHFLTFVCV